MKTEMSVDEFISLVGIRTLDESIVFSEYENVFKKAVVEGLVKLCWPKQKTALNERVCVLTKKGFDSL